MEPWLGFSSCRHFLLLCLALCFWEGGHGSTTSSSVSGPANVATLRVQKRQLPPKSQGQRSSAGSGLRFGFFDRDDDSAQRAPRPTADAKRPPAQAESSRQGLPQVAPTSSGSGLRVGFFNRDNGARHARRPRTDAEGPPAQAEPPRRNLLQAAPALLRNLMLSHLQATHAQHRRHIRGLADKEARMADRFAEFGEHVVQVPGLGHVYDSGTFDRGGYEALRARRQALRRTIGQHRATAEQRERLMTALRQRWGVTLPPPRRPGRSASMPTRYPDPAISAAAAKASVERQHALRAHRVHANVASEVPRTCMIPFSRCARRVAECTICGIRFRLLFRASLLVLWSILPSSDPFRLISLPSSFVHMLVQRSPS